MYTIYELVFRWLNESKNKNHIYAKKQIETAEISGTRRGGGWKINNHMISNLEDKRDSREQRADEHM